MHTCIFKYNDDVEVWTNISNKFNTYVRFRLLFFISIQVGKSRGNILISAGWERVQRTDVDEYELIQKYILGQGVNVAIPSGYLFRLICRYVI